MTTIKDVAKHANVSTATVSRIINGKGEASKETIERVMQIIQELNYTPSRLAKSLSTGKSDLIAVMIPDLMNPFFGEMIKALEQAAAQKGLRLLLCNTRDDRSSVEYYIQTILDNYVYGTVICNNQITEKDLDTLESQGIPTVTIDRSALEHKYSAVNVDQYHGVFIATEQLINSGGQEIVLLAGEKTEPLYQKRSQGYLSCLDQHGFTHPIIMYSDFTLDGGYQQTKKLLKEHPSCDGILACNDLMAMGAIRACADAGRAIPEQIKIIGIDNLMLDEYITPRLTSLSQQKHLVSRLAIEELVARQEDHAKPSCRTIKPKLILRETA